MSKEKKQFMVMGVLVLLVCAIGAFQFMGPGSKKPAPVVEEETLADKEPTVVVAANDTDITEQIIKQLMAGPGYEPRDPFTPQAVVADLPVQRNEQAEIQRPPVEMPRREIVGPIIPVITDPSIEPTEAPFGLLGVVIGRNTVAVFVGDDGGYVLAREGDKIGESTFVEEVSDQRVTLRHRGKLRVLALRGGN